MFNNVTLIGHLGSDAQSHTIRNSSTLTVISSDQTHLEEPPDRGTRGADHLAQMCLVRPDG